MVQPLLAKLSPRMIVQDIAGHRLFTVNMLPSGMAQLSDETQPGQTSKSETNCGPPLTWTGPPVAIIATTTNQDRPPEPLPAFRNTSQTEADHGEALELARRQTTKGEERTTLNVEESTVVIPKKRRYRGASRQKILIKWRNYTFPCIYSDLLTPATLIEDIGRNPRTPSEALAKATLTPPNNLLVTLHLHTPLHIQGVVAGDTLTLVIRHAKIYDPYHVQYFITYREEDTILYFLAALRDISPIPLRSELVICHKALPLEPASRSQDCNLPHEPTLHVRFSSHPDAHPHIEPVQLEPVGKAGDPLADSMNTSPLADGTRGNLRKTHDTRHAQGDIGMALSLSPSPAFVQDPEGKTHVLLFHPQDSIAKNLLRHSSQVHLLP